MKGISPENTFDIRIENSDLVPEQSLSVFKKQLSVQLGAVSGRVEHTSNDPHSRSGLNSTLRFTTNFSFCSSWL